MKKLVTLALALCVTFAGFAQVQKVSSNDAKNKVAQEQVVTGSEVFANVGSVANMTRSDAELDYTTYDWQTNTAAKNWTMTFPDGCVGFAYTIATDGSYSDRGTNIAIYNPATDEWTTTGGKIENKKTGFGCATRYGENGIVVVSRDANSLDCGVYIIEDKDNLPAAGTVAPIKEWTKDDRNIHFPTATCTGPNHDHIHILFTALNYVDDDGQTNPFYYFRSMDGGQTWAEFMTIPFLGRDYAPTYGSGQDAYFIENNGGNELNIVVNTRRGDGAILTSYDEGLTWERMEYYHHPGIDVVFDDSSLAYMYPRWTSALKDNNGVFHIAYEFGGATGDASSTSYYPGIGGVAYWSSVMPYRGDGSSLTFGPDPNNPMPPTQGHPFVMDSAYINRDVYASLWYWSDASHELWPEYMGYVTPLDANDDPLVDPYTATEWGIDDFTNHGHYNGGICEMPVLMMTPDQDLLVAVWMGMDEHNVDGTGIHYMKLFTRASQDNGESWTPMKHLTNDFMFQYSECVYPQAAITNNQLVIASQMDGEGDSYVIGSGGDTDQFDCYYQGLTFDLNDLFGYDAIDEPAVVNNTKMSIYPNPAVDRLNVTLNQNAEITVYNIMGQAIRTVEGHVGANQIDLSGLNSGVYFISAGSDTQKFIVK